MSNADVQTRPARPITLGPGFFRRRSVRVSIVVIATAALAIAGFCGRRYVQFRDHLDQANSATLDGRFGAAIVHLEACAEIDPEHRGVMLLEARLFRMMQSWSRAEGVLEHYWELYGDDDRLAYERLLLRAARDETDPVAGILATHIASGGEPARLARQALVSGCLREFRYGDAQDLLMAWRAASPDDPLADLLLGRFQDQLYRLQDAKETYAGIVARIQSHHEARLKLALLLMQDRQAGEAMEHLKILKESLPDNAEVAVQWALALRQLGRTDEAIRALDEALVKYPTSAGALSERGTMALSAGDDEFAESLLSRASQADPGSIGTRNLRAMALTRLGRTDEAAREAAWVKTLSTDADRIGDLVNGALQNRPDDPAPPFEIGGIALRAGQPSEAIRWYQTALKRDPNHGPSHTALAVIYLEIGNPVLATRHRALAASARPRR